MARGYCSQFLINKPRSTNAAGLYNNLLIGGFALSRRGVRAWSRPKMAVLAETPVTAYNNLAVYVKSVPKEKMIMSERIRSTTKTASEQLRSPAEEAAILDRDPKSLNTVDGHEYKPFDNATQDPGAGKNITSKEVADLHAKDTNRTQEATGEKPEGLPVKEAHLEQIRQTRAAEAKSLMAVVASERMLPLAPAHIIERNAADLLHLPTEALRNILARQERMAAELEETAAKAAGEEPVAPVTGEEPAAPVTGEENEKSAADKKIEDLEAQVRQMSAALEEIKNAAAPAAPAAPETPAAEDGSEGEEGNPFAPKTASVLESLFQPRQPAQPRAGAAFGKQAASQEDAALTSLWKSAPDVSHVFN